MAAHNTSSNTSSNTALNTVKCGYSIVELGVPGCKAAGGVPGCKAAGGVAPVQICISYNVGPTLVHIRRNNLFHGTTLTELSKQLY